MSSRKEDLDAYLRKLRVIRDALQSLRRSHEEAIDSLRWLNRVIDRHLADVKFLLDLYGPIDEAALDSVPTQDYAPMILPLGNVVHYGNAFISLGQDTPDIQQYLSRMIPLASSTSAVFAATTSGTTFGYMAFARSVPTETERLRGLLIRYLSELGIEDDIKYIRDRLPHVVPYVSADFEHFLSNYYATGDSQLKYQELIGFRSLFFIKLIDGFAAQHGANETTTRKGRILIFAAGGPDNKDKDVNRLANSAMSLWRDLSGQDSSQMSAKLGNVTAEYIKLLFNQCIVVAGSLLRENERNSADPKCA